jgi:hypothetical protein
MKKCSRCLEEKSLDGFHKSKNGSGGLRSECKDCSKIRDLNRYQKNKESENLRARQYYAENKKARIEYSRKYYNKNSEAIKEKAKKNYPKYKQLRMDNNRLRRAAKAGNDYVKYTLDQVIEVYGTICYLCKEQIDLSAERKPGRLGWKNGLHVDHVLDISGGGADTIDNVRPTHGICNLKKPRIKRA